MRSVVQFIPQVVLRSGICAGKLNYSSLDLLKLTFVHGGIAMLKHGLGFLSSSEGKS